MSFQCFFFSLSAAKCGAAFLPLHYFGCGEMLRLLDWLHTLTSDINKNNYKKKDIPFH